MLCPVQRLNPRRCVFSSPCRPIDFIIINRIRCRSKGVVCLLKCPCGLVAKLKGNQKQRFLQHEGSIKNKKDEKYPVARHITTVGHHTSSPKFHCTEVMHSFKKRGSWRRICIIEAGFMSNKLANRQVFTKNC